MSIKEVTELVQDIRVRLINLGYPAERMSDEQLTRMAPTICETISSLGASAQSVCMALRRLSELTRPHTAARP